jgi:hypothetical protein
MKRLAHVMVVAFSLVVAPPGTSSSGTAFAQSKTKMTPAQKKEAERKAQAAFLAGHYEEASQLLSNLYAEFGDPVYLRNIGRSYQRLKDPTRAIDAFEEYLQRTPDLSSAEREEVRGYIREMQDLKRQQNPLPPVVAPPPPVVTQPPLGTAPPPGPPAMVPPPETAPMSGMTTTPMISTTPLPPEPRRSSAPIIGGVIMGAGVLLGVAGGVFLASSWSEFNKGKDGKCISMGNCSSTADKVESRALLSKIFFGAAAAAVAVGGTVLIVGLSSSGPRASNGLQLALGRKF